MALHKLEVGKPFAPGSTRPEGGEFNWRSPECELILTFGRPSPDEVEAVRVGPAEFALYHDRDQIVLCYRFHPAPGRKTGMPWSDAPYHIGRLALAGRPASESVPPPDPATLSPESRQLLHVILLDEGGIVRVLRTATLSPEFTRALYAAVRDQASRSYDAAAYGHGLDMLYRRFDDSDQLAAACAVRCRGGD
jgi:hypothetical protein